MVKIENEQSNHLLCRLNQLVLHTTCDIPGDITLLNFMVKLVLWHLGPSTGLVRDDNCLDWNCNKNNTTSVHYRRLALQREADVYHSFRFGSWILEPSKMQQRSRQDNVLWCVRAKVRQAFVCMLDFFLMCSARSKWILKMKRTSKCENMNNWNAELSFMRVVHFSAYAL